MGRSKWAQLSGGLELAPALPGVAAQFLLIRDVPEREADFQAAVAAHTGRTHFLFQFIGLGISSGLEVGGFCCSAAPAWAWLHYFHRGLCCSPRMKVWVHLIPAQEEEAGRSLQLNKGGIRLFTEASDAVAAVPTDGEPKAVKLACPFRKVASSSQLCASSACNYSN